jgi:HsdM N-terminal domain
MRLNSPETSAKFPLKASASWLSFRNGSPPIGCRANLNFIQILRFMARTKNNTAANVGYEAELWQMADALRGSMDAAEYKHVVLGLIFLKYISNASCANTVTRPTNRRKRRRPYWNRRKFFQRNG